MSSISFAIDWEKGGASCVPEDVTVAELEVRIEGDPITRHRTRQGRRFQIADAVSGPVAGIVDWLIENWLQLFWETQTPFRKARAEGDVTFFPGVKEAAKGQYESSDEDVDDAAVADWQHRHLLGHASSDLALPSLVIVPELHHTIIEVDALPPALNPSVEFVDRDNRPREHALFVVRKADFKDAASELIDKTIRRAAEFPTLERWAGWLQKRWEESQAVEGNPGARLRAMLGELSARSIQQLEHDSPETARGLTDLLVDCPIVSEEDELIRVQEAVQADLLSNGHLPAWRQLDAEGISSARPPYQQGYHLARLVRKRVNLGTKPIIDFAIALRELDVTLDKPMRTQLFRTAVCAPPRGEAHILRSASDSRMDSLPSARFAVAAALGRLLWSATVSGDDYPICAAHGDYARLTQTQRANAFAAELLLPSAVLRSELGSRPTRGRLSDFAERFGISRSAARWHAHNALAPTKDDNSL